MIREVRFRGLKVLSNMEAHVLNLACSSTIGKFCWIEKSYTLVEDLKYFYAGFNTCYKFLQFCSTC